VNIFAHYDVFTGMKCFKKINSNWTPQKTVSDMESYLLKLKNDLKTNLSKHPEDQSHLEKVNKLLNVKLSLKAFRRKMDKRIKKRSKFN